MRLIWKKYDNSFDPVVTLIGVVFVLAGAYGIALIPNALRNPIVWLVAAIPLLMGMMGIITLVREFQLWKSK